MDYQSPGFAASSAFQQQLLNDAAMKRQAELDALNKRKVESEIEQGQAALQEKRNENAEKIREKERAETERDIAGMAPGDIPDADLIARAKKHHIPLRTTAAEPPEAPAPPESIAAPGQPPPQNPADVTPPGSGVLAEAPRGSIRYAGNPQQAIEAEKRKKIDTIINQISDLDPTSPDFKRLAAQYEMVAGKSLPAAFLSTKTATEGNEAVMRQHPKTGQVQRLIDGQWTDWTHDVPKGAHWMTVPDTSAADAAKSGRDAQRVQSLHEAATRELDTWSKTIQSKIDGTRELTSLLNGKQPVTDRLIAPLVLKAVVAGEGSGFRMTRAEIDNITHGRSRWENLKVAIDQWSADPTKALSLSDTQRADLLALAAEMRKRQNKVAHQIIDAREEYDNAMDAGSTARINKARTALQKQMMVGDENEDATAAAGAVGPTAGMTPQQRVDYYLKQGKK